MGRRATRSSRVRSANTTYAGDAVGGRKGLRHWRSASWRLGLLPRRRVDRLGRRLRALSVRTGGRFEAGGAGLGRGSPARPARPGGREGRMAGATTVTDPSG